MNVYEGALFQYQQEPSMDNLDQGSCLGKIRILFKNQEQATLILPNDQRLSLSRLRF